MPETESSRKRSRSPTASDGEQEKHYKRANTGAAQADESTTRNQSTLHGSVSPSPDTPLDDSTMQDLTNNNDGTASPSPTTNPTSAPAEADDLSASPVKTGDNQKQETGDDALVAEASLNSLPASAGATTTPPSAMIHMRCLIVTQDASIIIGKGGKHVNEIREKSGAKVMVSESIPGNPERILNVSGPLDAVSKVSCRQFDHA